MSYTYSLFSLGILLLSAAVVSADQNTAEASNVSFRIEQIADGLGVPWGMMFISRDEMVITERGGSIRRVDIKTGTKVTLKNSPEVLAEGQGGMLDVAVSPNFKKDGWIYFTYVKDVVEGGATVLARARLEDGTLVEWEDLLVTESATETSYHFGSRIAFDDDGHVFFSIGDRGVRENSQDLDNHAGSIMRVNLDGSVPEDNPYRTDPRFLPEVWSYGHRNPQGLAFDNDNKRLWSIEHGPRGGDEINLIRKAANYGWPTISYGYEYWGPIAVGDGTHAEGMEQPIKYYVPSIAPGSLMVYSGDAFPQWKGNLFSGALKLKHINRVVISKDVEAIKEERLLEDLGERIRSLTQDEDGLIYFATDSGKLYRMRPDG